ncbi:MAG: NAD(P)/FAD-dependent oxidoreductase [Burkholderiales bacterium]|nr:NAD(P)/FAD-dependent oxidoreductase [Burkholderiales bacterium]
MKNNQFDTIIIGAGAAGLMCAQFSGNNGQKTLLLDHSNKLAEKIRISGGGRCNFTNLNTAPECYISNNKHFMKSALSRYTPYHFTELLDKYNIAYHEKTLGQLFCNEKSQAIIDLLYNLCIMNHVTIKLNTQILKVEKDNQFIIYTNNGEYYADKLVIATGGLSIPQTGATPFGYNLAKQFDIDIVQTNPALVPLTLDPKDLNYFSHLSGISFDSITELPNISFKENSLFTHRGLSGPAILQISSYWSSGTPISINMMPTINIVEKIQEQKKSNKKLSTFLGQFTSDRMANSLVNILKFDTNISQLNNNQIKQINNLIHEYKFIPSGTEGYKKAEVTKGGVSTNELNSKTMMSNKVEGLYFIGEVVDVTGWLGGYNFQWAWASAYAASQNF